MLRSNAITHVMFVVDDALNGRRIGNDQLAIVRRCDILPYWEYASVLVGWNNGKGHNRDAPLFVAVHSCLDVKLDSGEAETLARDYLAEIGLFSCNGTHCIDSGCRLNSRPADFIIQ